jgi:hypothetical protein
MPTNQRRRRDSGACSDSIPFWPPLSLLVDDVLIRSDPPCPGVAMSRTSIAFSQPQYSLSHQLSQQFREERVPTSIGTERHGVWSDKPLSMIDDRICCSYLLHASAHVFDRKYGRSYPAICCVYQADWGISYGGHKAECLRVAERCCRIPYRSMYSVGLGEGPRWAGKVWLAFRRSYSMSYLLHHGSRASSRIIYPEHSIFRCCKDTRTIWAPIDPQLLHASADHGDLPPSRPEEIGIHLRI